MGWIHGLQDQWLPCLLWQVPPALSLCLWVSGDPLSLHRSLQASRRGGIYSVSFFGEAVRGHPPHQTAAEGQCGDLRPPQAFSGGAGKLRCAVEKGAECTFHVLLHAAHKLPGCPPGPLWACVTKPAPKHLAHRFGGRKCLWQACGGGGQQVKAAPQHSLLL